jgi:type IV secretion system protein VirB3
MSAQLDRDMVFGALTRPQMFAGVTYSYFVLNAVVTAELFLITKSFWALAAAVAIHLVGYVACLKEPRIFDLWLTKVSRCPRVKNWSVWRCNSYRP